jgi:hypothetical protein
LSDRHRVLVVDLPGHGDAAPFTLAGAVESVCAAIDEDDRTARVVEHLRRGGRGTADLSWGPGSGKHPSAVRRARSHAALVRVAAGDGRITPEPLLVRMASGLALVPLLGESDILPDRGLWIVLDLVIGAGFTGVALFAWTAARATGSEP